MSEPIQVEAGGGRSRGPKAIVIPPERAGLRIILSIVGSLITAAVAYYIMLPPLNFKSQEFYMYIGLVLASFVVFLFLLCRASTQPEYVPYVKQKALIPGIIIAALVLFFGIAWAISSPFFQARRYSEIMAVSEDVNFAEDIKEANFSAIPRLNEEVAKAVAERTLGDLVDYVSQFIITPNDTTQINYRGKPVRVVGLGYADVIKWLTNTKNGLPGYVIVDMANEKSEFVRLENYIQYTDTEHFGKLLKRHLRFQYPTYMFGVPNFEINDAGHPYWVTPRVDKTIGLLGGEDVIGVVLVDAVTGDCEEYTIEDARSNPALQWIDRVYSATMLTTQYNFYGKYAGGFWNSLLGQRGVKMTTADFSYIAKDDDVFMYTGVTSATADNSIIGFILANQRTKQSVFYEVKGATESSAMGAAQGLVSDYKWTATFPLLINISGQPTYFLSFVDDAKVVQGFSMVNVGQYNRIKVWGKTLNECTTLYIKALQDNGVEITQPGPPPVNPDINPDDGTPPVNPDGTLTATGTITDIPSAVINGNTVYYIQLDNAGPHYTLTAGQSPEIVLFSEGMAIAITYAPAEGKIIPALSASEPEA